MRDDTTVPVFMCMRISAISNRGAIEMDEILFIKNMLKSSATRGRVERREQGPNQQGGTGREDTFTHSRYRPTIKRCRPDRRQVRNSLSYNAD